jgi:membrane protein CcdC involved in cytochrome C biogenesis
MFESIGGLLDKLIMLLAGIFMGFIYPQVVKKRISKLDDIQTKEKEIKRTKLFRYLGAGLIIIAVLLLITN